MLKKLSYWLFPSNPKIYRGYAAVRVVCLLFLIVVVVRSCIHLFSVDGGAQSIAGIDTSVSGGNNIVALFHQWGASQLILVALLIFLFFYYPGLTSLVIGFLALDAPMRALAGQVGNLVSTQTPPGEALNWPVFFFLFALFTVSFKEKKPKV